MAKEETSASGKAPSVRPKMEGERTSRGVGMASDTWNRGRGKVRERADRNPRRKPKRDEEEDKEGRGEQAGARGG
jgi:hypothetical protein